MKRLLQVLIVFFLLVSTAAASYYYPAGNGYYYCRTSYGNDGWYYTRTIKPGYWYCGRWYPESYYYTRTYAIPKQQSVVYSTNWKTDLIKVLDRQKDTQLFVQALRESGLATPNVQVAAGASSYVAGTQLYQQGHYQPFAQQGSTLLGLKAYAPNIGQVDIQGTLNQLSRLAEQQMTAADNVSWAFGERVGQVTNGQLELAKIQEAGRVAVALAQVSSPPRQVTTQFEARSGTQQQGGPPQQQAEAPYQAQGGSAGPPPPPTPDGNGGAMAVVRVQELFRETCVKCHGPEKAKADLDLSNFANWGPDRLHEYGPKIAARIVSHDPDLQMPPPGSDLKPLSYGEIKLVLSVLP